MLSRIAVSQGPRHTAFDAASAQFLADQLHAELIRITSSVPEDRLAAESLEIQIRTALQCYSSAIHRLLTPLTFQS
jgi:hypothetical protein